jgi:dUTP pyrophosphatase
MEFTVNRNFFDFINSIKNKSSQEQFMYLSIFIDSNDGELKKLYVEAAQKHNTKILEDPHFYDAGFDLFLPKNSNEADIWGDGTRFYSTGWTDIPHPVNKVDFKVKCCAKMYNGTQSYFTPFYTYARSSMSKTPLRLANNQGIIDAGYRGNLIGMFDCIYNTDSNEDRDFDWHMEKYSRMLQICAPGLVPIYVNVVDKLEDLGPSTSRGIGGFGSTGK